MAFQMEYRAYVVLLPIAPAADPKIDTPKSTSSHIRSDAWPSPAPWRNRPQNRPLSKTSEIRLNQNIVDLITSFEKGRSGSLFLTDSTLERAELDKLNLVLHQYPFCQLTMVLLLRKNLDEKTVSQIASVRDFQSQNLVLGVTNPTRDGMGLAAINMISQNHTLVDASLLNELIRYYDSHESLLAALEQGEVDGILVWDSLQPQAESFAQVVALTLSEEQTDLIPPLANLRVSAHDAIGKRFADFLISDQGKSILRKYGFVPLMP